MILLTTPIIELKIKNVNLSEADSILVTLAQGNKKVEKAIDPESVTVETVGGVTVSVIQFHLEQIDTKDFTECWGMIQVNWLYTQNGETLRDATVAKNIKFGIQLHNTVMSGVSE